MKNTPGALTVTDTPGTLRELVIFLVSIKGVKNTPGTLNVSKLS